MPKVEKFSLMIDQFMKDNQMMRECVAKFDQTISLKANKGEL